MNRKWTKRPPDIFVLAKSYSSIIREVIDGPSTNLEDAHTTLLAGKRKILLKLTSGKSLSSKVVLHVPHIRRNLVYESSLNKVGTMFDASKLVVNYN